MSNHVRPLLTPETIGTLSDSELGSALESAIHSRNIEAIRLLARHPHLTYQPHTLYLQLANWNPTIANELLAAWGDEPIEADPFTALSGAYSKAPFQLFQHVLEVATRRIVRTQQYTHTHTRMRTRRVDRGGGRCHLLIRGRGDER